MKAGIVFDIGGTSIRASLYVENKGLQGEFLKIDAPNFLVNSQSSIDNLQNSFIDACSNLVDEIKNKNKGMDINNIGISFPGPIDDKGNVVAAPTLWGKMQKPYPLQTVLQKKFAGYNITIINDITAAGWRYMDKYNGTFCIITISSGVGCKVFWDNKLLLNKNGFGGELGHNFFSKEYSDIPCDCGDYGHVGSISSGRGIEKLFLHLKNINPPKENSLLNKKSITTYEIISALQNNDEYAYFLLRESIKPIAHSISTLYSFIGLTKYIIMGGFALAIRQLYIDVLKDELVKLRLFGLDSTGIEDMVFLSENDDYHGLIGIGKYMLEVNH